MGVRLGVMGSQGRGLSVVKVHVLKHYSDCSEKNELYSIELSEQNTKREVG